MIVTPKYIDPKNVPSNISKDFNYGLELNKEYFVLAVLNAVDQVWYLVDEGGKPSFFPFQIFDIKDHKLNVGYFNLINWEDNVYPLNKKCIWGYYEICFNANHYEELIDRKDDAIKIYFERKQEMKTAYKEGYLYWPS